MRDNYRHNDTPQATRGERQVLDAARAYGILRPRDLEAAGIHREYLPRLCRKGLLVRTGRGLYRLPDAEVTENHTLAEVAKRVPRGVVCLLSALRFHGLTTQAPFEVWMAIGGKDRRPRNLEWKVRFLRFSGQALEHGVQTHLTEGVTVKVYSPAKTVADCFKFRSKVGQNVAVEALQDCLKSRSATVEQIWTAAKVCRVTSIIRPYLEALL